MPNEAARMNYKQAIIVAVITSITSIVVTLISTGTFSRAHSKMDEANLLASIPDTNCPGLEDQVERLRSRVSASIPLPTLFDMSDRFFVRNADIDAYKDSLRSLIRYAEAHLHDRDHYLYQLFALKKIMLNQPNRNINTRVGGVDAETYKMIQSMLKDIEYYQGPVDGDRISTRQAVVAFQRRLNEMTPGYIAERNYGIFGNSTLNAIASIYEKSP